MPTYTNLFTNPRPIDSTGWATSAGTGGVTSPSILTSAGGPAGGQARRITWTTANTGGVSGPVAGGSAVAATAGTTYSIAGYVRPSKAQSMEARIQFFDSGGASTGTASGTLTSTPGNSWTLIKCEGAVAPANTVNIRCALYVPAGAGSLWAINDWLDAQAATILQGGTVPQPFHGSMTDDATHDYAWTGAADASTSTLTIAAQGPTGLVATPVAPDRIDETWDPVSGKTYYLERDGTVIASGLPSTSYSDTGLAPGSTHTYRVGVPA